MNRRQWLKVAGVAGIARQAEWNNYWRQERRPLREGKGRGQRGIEEAEFAAHVDDDDVFQHVPGYS